MIENLHFVRPLWFFAFIPLIIFLVFLYRRHGSSGNWKNVCDAKLLPYVLSEGKNKASRFPLLMAALAASLCIIATAGPAFEKLPKPVYREQSTLIILMDLSQSMDAGDLRPSRIERAKLKLLDILKLRKSGQTALVVYAADAFVVTPLTDDSNTIASLVPTLETALMPSQGSHAYIAINKSLELLQQTSTGSGDVLLITDEINQRDMQAIKNLSAGGHRLSVLGVGTENGAPISMGSGFLQDKQGAIIIPKLDQRALQKAALNGGGLYAQLEASDADIIRLNKLFTSRKFNHDENDDEGMDLTADIWQEEGPWLLLFVIPLVALWARKGWLLSLSFLVFLLPVNEPAYALDVDHLWRSPDQKGMQAFNEGDAKKAAEEFQHNNWKASAHYRAGDYEKAITTLQEPTSSDDFYNKGNALAQLQKYPEAVEAYEKALELDADNEDAEFNRTQVKQFITQQDPAKNEGEGDDSEKSDEKQEDQGGEQDGEKKEGEDGQPSDKNEGEQDQQDSDSESEEQSDSEQSGKQSESENEDQKEQEKTQQEVDQALEDAQEEKQQAQADEQDKDGEDGEQQPQVSPMEQAELSEDDKAVEQWLKRVPDNPENLLRRKFLYQYKNMKQKTPSQQTW